MRSSLDGFEGSDLVGEIILMIAKSGEDGWSAWEGAGGGEDGVEVGYWVVAVCKMVLVEVL